jgi:hypothetical protein
MYPGTVRVTGGANLGASPSVFVLRGGDRVSVFLQPMQPYTVREDLFAISPDPRNLPNGYSPNCQSDGVAAPRGSVVVHCYITNSLQPLRPLPGEAQLVVYKRVINDNGGAARPSDARISVSPDAVLRDPKSPGPTFYGSSWGTLLRIRPGVETIVTEMTPDGYELRPDRTCNLPNGIRAGETRTCVLTNDDLPNSFTRAPANKGRLIVYTDVTNDNGGAARPEDFTFRITPGRGASLAPTAFQGNPLGTVVIADSNTQYLIRQREGPSGYAETRYGDCGTATRPAPTRIQPFQDRYCFLILDDNPRPTDRPRLSKSIFVYKHVINDNRGTWRAQDFSFWPVFRITSPDPNNPEDVIVSNVQGTIPTDSAGNIQRSNPMVTRIPFDARFIGSFRIMESEVPGYELTRSVCNPSLQSLSAPFSLSALRGPAIVCHIVNDDVRGSIFQAPPRAPAMPVR